MLVPLAMIFGNLPMAKAAVEAVASPDPTYCPLKASTCWKSTTCPTTDCVKDSQNECTPKGWEATHSNAMKYMDDKLKTSYKTRTETLI